MNVLFQKAYPLRLKHTHIMFPPNFIDVAKNLLKPFVSKKMFARVSTPVGKSCKLNWSQILKLSIFIVLQLSFHKNVETLWEHIPRDVLPEEYGGYGGNLDVIRGKIKYVQKWKLSPNIPHSLINYSNRIKSFIRNLLKKLWKYVYKFQNTFFVSYVLGVYTVCSSYLGLKRNIKKPKKKLQPEFYESFETELYKNSYLNIFENETETDTRYFRVFDFFSIWDKKKTLKT